MRRAGFTMIELLVAMALTATIVAGAVFAFTTASRIWRDAASVADSLHHGDYIAWQLTSALRSAYYPDSAEPGSMHGFVLENDGDEEEARDSISWVKMGSALVGGKFAGWPHRIKVFTLAEGESDDETLAQGGLVVRAWRVKGQVSDFDPEDDEFVTSRLLEPNVLAADFQVLDPEGNMAEGKDPVPDEEEEDAGLKWIDEDWKDDYTNRLPYAVKATLYMKPAERGGSPVALRRLVTIPVAPLSWRDKGAAGGSKETTAGGGEKGKKAKPSGDARERVPPAR